MQGSYLIEELSELVEEAVLREFEIISDKGGVLGCDGKYVSAIKNTRRISLL